MKLINKLTRASAFCVAACFLPAAQASVMDFTSSSWSAAQGQASHSFWGVTLSASGTFINPTPAVLTFNGNACGNATVGLACAGDGIGIDRTSIPIEDVGEVGIRELLNVNFGGPVQLQQIDFLNLFAGERLEIRANGTGSWTLLGPSSSQTGGYFSSALNPAVFSNVNFLDIRGANLLSDGSLARISYVPVPGTLALLLMGAMGFYQLRRNKSVSV